MFNLDSEYGEAVFGVDIAERCVAVAAPVQAGADGTLRFGDGA